MLLEMATREGNARISASCAALSMEIMENLVHESTWSQVLQHCHLVDALNYCVGVLRTCCIEGPQMDEQAYTIHSLLLLACEIISYSPSGTESLISQGICSSISTISIWVREVMPNSGFAGAQPENTLKTGEPEVFGCYKESGERYIVQKIWCSILRICSLLWASLPGHRQVSDLLLRISVSMSERLLLASTPPQRDYNQVLTRALVDETKASIIFFCSIAKIDGLWLLAQPQMMSFARMATSSLVAFIAQEPNIDCCAISVEEREQALSKKTSLVSNSWIDMPINLGTGKPCEWNGNGVTLIESPNKFGEDIGTNMFAIAKHALSFQVLASPEINEAEAALLDDKWISSHTLQDIMKSAGDVLLSFCKASFSDSIPKALIQNCMGIISNSNELLSITSSTIPKGLGRDLAQVAIKVQSFLAQ